MNIFRKPTVAQITEHSIDEAQRMALAHLATAEQYEVEAKAQREKAKMYADRIKRLEGKSVTKSADKSAIYQVTTKTRSA